MTPDIRATELILADLAPQCVLVGSAAHGEEFRDLDLVVADEGMDLARREFADHPTVESVIVGHLKTWDTDPPLEVMVYFYGYGLEDLLEDTDNLTKVERCGVEFTAWVGSTEGDYAPGP